jgi:hypothetical protein
MSAWYCCNPAPEPVLLEVEKGKEATQSLLHMTGHPEAAAKAGGDHRKQIEQSDARDEHHAERCGADQRGTAHVHFWRNEHQR